MPGTSRLLGGLILMTVATSHSIPVEASHPVYTFLRRLEEKGIIAPSFLGTLPRDESEVSEALELAASRKSTLTSWDRARLERFRDQFDPDRKASGSRLRYQDSSFTLHGSVEYFTGIYGRDSIPNPDVYASGGLAPRLQLTHDRGAYLDAGASVGMERNLRSRFSGENYLPDRGLPFNVNRVGDSGTSAKVSTFDGFRILVGAGARGLRLEAGQDWNQWGPGYWQHATLGTRPYFWVSDSLPSSADPGFNGTAYPGSYRRGYRYPGEGPPLPQLRLRLGSDQHRWEYVKIVAKRTGLWKDSSATLIAHRIQFRVGSWRIGATEMLAVGERETDWMLMIPGLPLKFAEHSGGNRDNVAMSVDAEWIWRGHGRVYGELLVDDFSGPPLDYWGNKFAWTLGGTWHDPFGTPAELRAEYSRVDPWVYGHHLRGTQFQSYGALLGSALPPNSHAFRGSADFPLFREVSGRIEYRFGQRDFRSPGSSIFDTYNPDEDGYRKSFLAQSLETRHEATLHAEWQWRRYLELRGSAGWIQVDGWKGAPGENLSTPVFGFETFLRY